MKTYRFIGVAVLALILVMSSVSAFAISSPYWNDNPLQISPGESKDFQIILNNGGGAIEDMKVQCGILEGADIGSIIDSGVYDVAADGKAGVNLRVVIPDNAVIGESKTVRISCTPVSLGAGSAPMMLSQAIEQEIPVSVIEKVVIAESEESGLFGGSSWVYVLIGIAMLVVLIIFLSRKRK